MSDFILFPNMSGLGERVESHRRRLNLNQVEAAEALRIDRATFSQIEGGRLRPTEEVLLRMAKLFRTPPEFLVWGDRADIVAGYVVVCRKAEPAEVEE